MTMFFRLDAAAAVVAQAFGARAGNDPWAGGTISPGGFAPVITAGREFVAGPRPAGVLERRMVPRQWGVPPPPSAGGAGGSGVLTVRNPDSPFWIGNLRNSEFRCLIPASAFVVWGKGVDREGKRRRLSIRMADQPLFAMAGVWLDSEVPSFAILTCEANAALRAEGRETMPVILPADPRGQELWLRGDWKRAQALIAPYGSGMLQIGAN